MKSSITTITALVEKIYAAEQELLDRQSEVAVAVDLVAALEAEIETAIAFSNDFKNEQQQRKAAKLDWQAGEKYTQRKNQLQEAKYQVAKTEIELGYWRNLFAVAKLELRLQTSKLEAAA